MTAGLMAFITAIYLGFWRYAETRSRSEEISATSTDIEQKQLLNEINER